MPMTMKSPAFSAGKEIPARYTCTGENISPPLSWEGRPTGTRAFALVMDDPDSPRKFTHWLLYNIPAEDTGLDEDIGAHKRLPDGALQGTNSFGNIGYGCPCPPRGASHHYRFDLYALDDELDLPPGEDKETLLSSMEGHVLEKFELTGIFRR